VFIYPVSLDVGQSAVWLYGQTDQVLPKSLLGPAQRNQGLGLIYMTLQEGGRCISYLASTHLNNINGLLHI